MARVEIIGPKGRFFDAVSLLHEHGKLHIEDLAKKIDAGELPLDQMEVVQEQVAESGRMEELLIRVRAVLKALQLPNTQVDEVKRQKEYLRLWQLDSRQLAEEIESVINEVEERTGGLATSQTDLKSELALLARYEPILHKIQPLAKQIVTTGGFDSVALLVERRYKGALEQLKDELDKITNKQCEIVSTDVDEDTTAAIVVFNRAYAEPVHKFLAIENVNQIRLPSDLEGMPFDQAYDTIRERQRTLPSQLDDVQKELEAMSAKWYLNLATIRDVLSDRIDEISAIPKFGQTEYAFVVTGWIPVNDMSDLRNTLSATFGDDVIVNQLEIDEHEFGDTPVALSNPKAATPYEALLGLLGGGLPKYGTLDPTIILAVFYPVIFGMMVGDIGYGGVMLALVLWLRFKFRDKPFAQLSTGILGPACTMAIVFGFIYGEFFGNLLERYHLIRPISVFGAFELPLVRTRASLAIVMIVLSLAMGIIQVVFGLIVGVINGVKTRHMSHVWEKGGMLGVLGGALLFGIAAIPAFAPVGLVIQAAAMVAIIGGLFFAVKGGAAVGVVESISQFADIASYIRIMAVGLAGAIFADAVNELAAKLGFAGILVGLLLHIVNVVIAAFSPNIHALRLNFKEFFLKFYEPSKNEYSPFHKSGGEKSA